MSGQPILGTSENTIDTEHNSETQFQSIMSKDLNTKIFDSQDVVIPDFSEVLTMSPPDKQYHCLTKPKTAIEVIQGENNTIDTIMRRLNQETKENKSNQITKIDDVDETKNFVTNGKFSTKISDLNLDFLSIINLVRTLNKSVANQSTEHQNLSRDLCRLVEENTRLKESMSKLKVENDRRYDSMCKVYDSKIDDFSKRLGQIERSTRTGDNNIFGNNLVEGSKQQVRVVKKNNEDTVGQKNKASKTKEVVNNKNKKDDEDSAIDEAGHNQSEDTNEEEETQEEKVIMFNDRQLEKRLPKTRVKTAVRKNGGGDVFGDVAPVIDGPVMGVAHRQQTRREGVENNVKKIPDTKTERAMRLRLVKSSSLAEKTTIKRM